MSTDIARQRYLQRHIEQGLPTWPQREVNWHNVLVIPAYREAAGLLERLRALPTATGQTLVILVLNRPDSDPDPDGNGLLRRAIHSLPGGACGLRRLNERNHLYLHDLDRLTGPLPAAAGVGLARKIGCDIAFKWHSEGAITGRWIYSTDADARLPPDYFQALDGVTPGAGAATFPFWHTAGADDGCNRATALYELRLHHYVRGLEYAGSPYAYHTLGSCLALTFDAYARVRGFPKRAGGEDFYLLNKLVKTAPVIRLGGQCIDLESRHSHRVPFGTGPAVARIGAAEQPRALPLFYHPACFEALRSVLVAAGELWRQPAEALPALLATTGLGRPLTQACCTTLAAMGLADALAHCRRQGKSSQQFLRQFHQWFDAFRTLKFIHALRDTGWPACSLAALEALRPRVWPLPEPAGVDDLRRACAQHWGWAAPPCGQPPDGTRPKPGSLLSQTLW